MDLHKAMNLRTERNCKGRSLQSLPGRTKNSKRRSRLQLLPGRRKSGLANKEVWKGPEDREGNRKESSKIAMGSGSK